MSYAVDAIRTLSRYTNSFNPFSVIYTRQSRELFEYTSVWIYSNVVLNHFCFSRNIFLRDIKKKMRENINSPDYNLYEIKTDWKTKNKRISIDDSCSCYRRDRNVYKYYAIRYGFIVEKTKIIVHFVFSASSKSHVIDSTRVTSKLSRIIIDRYTTIL